MSQQIQYACSWNESKKDYACEYQMPTNQYSEDYFKTESVLNIGFTKSTFTNRFRLERMLHCSGNSLYQCMLFIGDE